MILKKTLILCNIRNYSTATLLDLNPKELSKFFSVHKLRKSNITQLQRTEKFLKKSGYKTNELIRYGAIFKYSFHILDQKMFTLKEGGFRNISLPTFFKFRNITNKNIKDLKELGYISKETEVAKLLLNKLAPLDCDIKLDDLLNESTTFSNIHRSITARYLVYRLEGNEDRVTSLFRVHHRLNLKPLSYLCWNIDFALSIGYTKEKILKNIYILCTNPKNTIEVINELPQLLADINIKNEMFVYPKLIGIPLDNFHKIYKTLKKYGIKDEAIKKSMNVFTLSTKTVEKRLQEIQGQPEMRVLLYEPAVLKLIVHHNRAKSRLKTLREYKMKCAALKILGNDGTNFDDHVKDGKDKNYNQEVYRFIKRILKCNTADIKDKLRCHPYFNYVPLISIQDTYFYLKSLQFTDVELREVVQLLLYPRYKVKDGYDKCKTYCKHQGLSQIHNVQTLNLILYFIEKEHHFTGNGIWTTNEENLM